jgi:hypothetical protein
MLGCMHAARRSQCHCSPLRVTQEAFESASKAYQTLPGGTPAPSAPMAPLQHPTAAGDATGYAAPRGLTAQPSINKYEAHLGYTADRVSTGARSPLLAE